MSTNCRYFDLWRRSPRSPLIALIGFRARAIREASEQQLEHERAQVDAMIHSHLPRRIASALKRGRAHVVERHPDVSVIVAKRCTESGG